MSERPTFFLGGASTRPRAGLGAKKGSLFFSPLTPPGVIMNSGSQPESVTGNDMLVVAVRSTPIDCSTRSLLMILLLELPDYAKRDVPPERSYRRSTTLAKTSDPPEWTESPEDFQSGCP